MPSFWQIALVSDDQKAGDVFFSGLEMFLPITFLFLTELI